MEFIGYPLKPHTYTLHTSHRKINILFRGKNSTTPRSKSSYASLKYQHVPIKFSVNCDRINFKYAYLVSNNFWTNSDFQLKLCEENLQFESNKTDFFQQTSFRNVCKMVTTQLEPWYVKQFVFLTNVVREDNRSAWSVCSSIYLSICPIYRFLSIFYNKHGIRYA